MALALQIKRGKLWLVNLKMLTVKQFMIDTVLTLRRGKDEFLFPITGADMIILINRQPWPRAAPWYMLPGRRVLTLLELNLELHFSRFYHILLTRGVYRIIIAWKSSDVGSSPTSTTKCVSRPHLVVE